MILFRFVTNGGRSVTTNDKGGSMPAHVWTDTWKVKPGRIEDFVSLMERFDGILARLDVSPSYHTVVQELAGPGAGGLMTFHHTFGYPSYEEYGKATDIFFEDPEFQELFGEGALGPDAPAETVNGQSVSSCLCTQNN